MAFFNCSVNLALYMERSGAGGVGSLLHKLFMSLAAGLNFQNEDPDFCRLNFNSKKLVQLNR
jgi:hypothetical protein